MNARQFDDWVWADGDAAKSVARILLVVSAVGAVTAAAVTATYVLPWWVTLPTLGYGLARAVWWTIR